MAKVFSVDETNRTAVVVVGNQSYKVQTETRLVKDEVLRLLVEKDEQGRLLWKILAPLKEKSPLSGLPSNWIQAFAQLDLALKPERISARLVRFGQGDKAAEWGAQAEARSWTDAPSFISDWSQIEFQLETDLRTDLNFSFPQLTEKATTELAAWNGGVSFRSPVLRLYPCHFSWKKEPGLGWIKTWSDSSGAVLHWSFLTTSFNLPLVVAVAAPKLRLRFFHKTDEAFYRNSVKFQQRVKSILGDLWILHDEETSHSKTAISLRGVNVQI